MAGLAMVLLVGCSSDPLAVWQKEAAELQARILPHGALNLQSVPARKEGQAFTVSWSITTAMREDAYLRFLAKQMGNDFIVRRSAPGTYFMTRYEEGTLDTLTVREIPETSHSKFQISWTSRPD